MAGVGFPGDRSVLQLLTTAFERAPFGVAFYDPSLRFIDVNETFAAMGGRSREDHVGRGVYEMLPRMADAIAPHLRAVFERSTAVRDIKLAGFRNPSQHAPGHWLVSYQPVRDADETVAVVAIVADVTAQRRAEAILQAQRDVLERCVLGESLSSVLDRITSAISEYSDDGAIPSILLVEDGVLRHGSAPHLPREYTAAIDGLPIGPAQGSCGTAAFRGTPVFVRDIATDPLWDGFRELALPHGLRSCWSVPITGSRGEVLGTFALYHREPIAPSLADIDLTTLMSRTVAVLIEWWHGEQARQRLLQQEQQAREAAEAANRGKDEFVATLSHELRTPLNAIMGWTRMLRMPGVPALTAERAMDAIDRNAKAQARLIEDLLDIARIARGGLRLDVASVDLLTVVNGAVEAIKPVADAKGVRLTTEVSAAQTRLDADSARLQQVIWNLLSNAVKFTPSGGDVVLAVQHDGAAARVTVSDTGIGIPPELLPHVFERYRQGKGSDGGLGLGLAIANSVATLHGGTLRAQSAGVGRGARFELVLPARPAAGQNSGAGASPT